MAEAAARGGDAYRLTEPCRDALFAHPITTSVERASQCQLVLTAMFGTSSRKPPMVYQSK